MRSKRILPFTTAVPLACVLALAGCGGGKSSSSSTPTPTPTPTPSSNVVVTGVAAIGAPLSNATITAVDGNGAPVTLLSSNGSTIPYAVANVADGSYTLNLNTKSPKYPLFIEAVGSDATGLPVVLHSLVQSTTTTPLVANITPLTNAVVAEILGANPQGIFQNASNNASSIGLLGNATMVTASTTQIETIIAKNLTDAKVVSSTSLNLFQDGTFKTNKTLLDATLSGLRVQIVKDANNNDQLQLSNLFVAIGSPEVEISLATAKTQLGLGTTGKLSSAIVSTGITTTSATTVIQNLATLDNLTIQINTLIAQRVAATGFAPLASAIPAPPSPTPATGTVVSYAYNGRNFTALEQLLEGYANNNYQLSSMQVTGCVDDPIPTKGCTNVAVAAVVTDVNGNVVDLYSDGVAYSKTTTPNWLISGNGRYAQVGVYPVAYLQLGEDGSLTSTTGSNPGTGLQVNILAQNSAGTEIVGNSAVQLLSDQSVPFAYCGVAMLCLWTNPSVLPTATGNLSDTLLQPPTLGWLGSVDAVVGAKYVVNYASWITVTNQTANAYLPTNLPTNLATNVFPALDGVSGGSPLTGTNIVAGPAVSWTGWAALNPNMKVFSVRTVVSGAGASPIITDNAAPFSNATNMTLAPTTLPTGFVPTSYSIWIGAVDSLGHRYFTQYAGSS